MFDSIGFQELVLIGLVALLVVGPKELPLLMRKGGQWMAKMRGMAADFRATFDEMARQAELDELRKEVEALRTQNPITEITDELSKPFDTAGEPYIPNQVDPYVPGQLEDEPAMTPLVEPIPTGSKKPRKPRAKKVVEDAPA